MMQSPLRPASTPRAGRNGRLNGHPRASVDDARDERPRTAADVDRDAKSATVRLRDLLNAQAPWSKEVEFHRQKARNLYLTLLFEHPLSTQAQSLDPLWLNTSYTLIAAYRDALARADAAAPPTKKNRMADPETRKVLTRFRQALASEESFYRTLVGRIVGFYQLQESTKDYLRVLSIPVPEHVVGGVLDHGLAPAPIRKDEGREKVALVYKALICLGDLERYKVQYGEKARREPKSRSEEMYAKATTYYDVARNLMPDDGSAFNQLAVISTYLPDDLQTTYYYFRALAVRSAFKNGGEILERYLKKLFEREHQEALDEDGWCRLHLLKIAAILYRRIGLSQLIGHVEPFTSTLENLLAMRRFPSEVIVKIIVICIGTQWHARSAASLAPGESDAQAKRRTAAEEEAVSFLLSTAGILFDVAAREVEVADAGSAIEDDTAELHSHITAVLRRTLPALRIISKWLKLHLDYLSRFTDKTASRLTAFWATYHRFINAVSRVFPLASLPGLIAPLEEDIDMRGFIPLSRGLTSGREADAENGHVEEAHVHPNEEQLMRVADLQVDATLIIRNQAGNKGLTSLFDNHHLIASSDVLPVSFSLPRDDELASVSTETEDDPVSMAMRATLTEAASSIGDDEEVILWGKGSHTPQGPPGAPHGSVPTAYDLLQSIILEPTASPHNSTPSAAPRTATAAHRPSPTAIPASGQGSPGLLFGGDAGGIWRMTREESEKGQKRAERNKEETQREAIKAIWGEPVLATAMAKIGNGSPAQVTPLGPGGMQQQQQQQAAAAQVGWGNDAASLLAGLSGWATPGQHSGTGSTPLSVGGPRSQAVGQPAWGYDPAYQAYGQQAQWEQTHHPG